MSTNLSILQVLAVFVVWPLVCFCSDSPKASAQSSQPIKAWLEWRTSVLQFNPRRVEYESTDPDLREFGYQKERVDSVVFLPRFFRQTRENIANPEMRQVGRPFVSVFCNERYYASVEKSDRALGWVVSRISPIEISEPVRYDILRCVTFIPGGVNDKGSNFENVLEQDGEERISGRNIYKFRVRDPVKEWQATGGTAVADRFQVTLVDGVREPYSLAIHNAQGDFWHTLVYSDWALFEKVKLPTKILAYSGLEESDAPFSEVHLLGVSSISRSEARKQATLTFHGLPEFVPNEATVSSYWYAVVAFGLVLVVGFILVQVRRMMP